MMFGDLAVDPNIVSWNKLVLLHGPPGTGKTTLCKALAQKMAIRQSSRYTRAELVEINSHSLFSKWFSESGKLVTKLFQELRLLLECPTALICILVDEVESLAHVRKSSANGTEPSDSIRVVNALLTQLDQIKSFPNVLILTTSNVTEAIDLAFLDRADIKQYIGPPNTKVIYKIYTSCLKELMKRNIIDEEDLCSYEYLQTSFVPSQEQNCHGNVEANSHHLLNIARESNGLSARALRKVPFLAHALFLQALSERCNLPTFLNAMYNAVQKVREE